MHKNYYDIGVIPKPEEKKLEGEELAQRLLKKLTSGMIISKEELEFFDKLTYDSSESKKDYIYMQACSDNYWFDNNKWPEETRKRAFG